MAVVGLIPARGGSKGIPRKNLALAAGRSLLAWTVDAATASGGLDRAVVSTEDAEIASVARSLGADVLERPAELAADDTPMRAVVEHALAELPECEVLVLLQPTSPLRRAEHIDAAVALLRESDADCVVSVTEVPHAFTPGSLLALEDGRLVPHAGPGPTRRQDKPILYARNGPAVLALRVARLPVDGGLYGDDCRPLIMDARDSLDVDGPFELELAGMLLRERIRAASELSPLRRG